jgi:hypothetical protein
MPTGCDDLSVIASRSRQGRWPECSQELHPLHHARRGMNAVTAKSEGTPPFPEPIGQSSTHAPLVRMPRHVVG